MKKNTQSQAQPQYLKDDEYDAKLNDVPEGNFYECVEDFILEKIKIKNINSTINSEDGKQIYGQKTGKIQISDLARADSTWNAGNFVSKINIIDKVPSNAKDLTPLNFNGTLAYFNEANKALTFVVYSQIEDAERKRKDIVSQEITQIKGLSTTTQSLQLNDEERVKSESKVTTIPLAKDPANQEKISCAIGVQYVNNKASVGFIRAQKETNLQKTLEGMVKGGNATSASAETFEQRMSKRAKEALSVSADSKKHTAKNHLKGLSAIPIEYHLQTPISSYDPHMDIKTTLAAPEKKLDLALNLDASGLNNIKIDQIADNVNPENIDIEPLYKELKDREAELKKLKDDQVAIKKNYETQLSSAEKKLKELQPEQDTATAIDGAGGKTTIVASGVDTTLFESTKATSDKTIEDNKVAIDGAEVALQKAQEAYDKACVVKAENFQKYSVGGENKTQDELIAKYKAGEFDDGFKAKPISTKESEQKITTGIDKARAQIMELKQRLTDEFNAKKDKLNIQIQNQIGEATSELAKSNKRPSKQQLETIATEIQDKAREELARLQLESQQTLTDAINGLAKQVTKDKERVESNFQTQVNEMQKAQAQSKKTVQENLQIVEKKIEATLKKTFVATPSKLTFETDIKIAPVDLQEIKLEKVESRNEAEDIKIASAYINLKRAEKHLEDLKQKNNTINTEYTTQVNEAEAFIKSAVSEKGKDGKADGAEKSAEEVEDIAVSVNDEVYKQSKTEQEEKQNKNTEAVKAADALVEKLKAEYEALCNQKADNAVLNNPDLKKADLINEYKEGKLGETLTPEDLALASEKEISVENISQGTQFTAANKNTDAIFTESENIKKETNAKIKEIEEELNNTINRIKAEYELKLGARMAEKAKELTEITKEEIDELSKEGNTKLIEAKQEAQEKVNEAVEDCKTKIAALNVQLREVKEDINKLNETFNKANTACAAVKATMEGERKEVEKKDVDPLNVTKPFIEEDKAVYKTQDIYIGELHRMYHEAKEQVARLERDKTINLKSFQGEIAEVTKEVDKVKEETLTTDTLNKLDKDVKNELKKSGDNNEIYDLAKQKMENIERAFEKACEVKAKHYIEYSDSPTPASEEAIKDAYFKTPKDKNPDLDAGFIFKGKDITLATIAKNSKVDLNATQTSDTVTLLKAQIIGQNARDKQALQTAKAEIAQQSDTISKNLNNEAPAGLTERTAVAYQDTGLMHMGMNSMNISIDTSKTNDVPDFANTLEFAINALETANKNYIEKTQQQAEATVKYNEAVQYLNQINTVNGDPESDISYDEADITSLQDRIKALEVIQEQNETIVKLYEEKLKEATEVMDSAIEQYNDNKAYYANVTEITERFSKGEKSASTKADLDVSITVVNESEISTKPDAKLIAESIKKFRTDRSNEINDKTRAKDKTCTFISKEDCANVNTANIATTNKITSFEQAKGVIKSDTHSPITPSEKFQAVIEEIPEPPVAVGTPRKSIPSYEGASGFRLAIVGDPGDIDKTKYTLNTDTGLMEDKTGRSEYKYSEFGGTAPLSKKASDVYNKNFNPCMLEGVNAVAHVNINPMKAGGSPKDMHKVYREFVPTGKEGSLILGNKNSGFLEIKSDADHKMDQLTITTKDGKAIDLFNPNPEQGVSSSRAFHQAFKNNSSLKKETTYFNTVDPKTKEELRVCVNSEGYYHVNSEGGIDRSRKISYGEMDKICEATVAAGKAIETCKLYNEPSKPVTQEVLDKRQAEMNNIQESKQAIDEGKVLTHKYIKDQVEVKVDPKDTTINQVTAKTKDNQTTDLFTEDTPSPSQRFAENFKKISNEGKESVYFTAANPESPDLKTSIRLTPEGEFKARDNNGVETPLTYEEMDKIVSATIERAKAKECIALDNGKAGALKESTRDIILGSTTPSAPSVVDGVTPPTIDRATPTPTPPVASEATPDSGKAMEDVSDKMAKRLKEGNEQASQNVQSTTVGKAQDSSRVR